MNESQLVHKLYVKIRITNLLQKNIKLLKNCQFNCFFLYKIKNNFFFLK